MHPSLGAPGNDKINVNVNVDLTDLMLSDDADDFDDVFSHVAINVEGGPGNDQIKVRLHLPDNSDNLDNFDEDNILGVSGGPHKDNDQLDVKVD